MKQLENHGELMKIHINLEISAGITNCNKLTRKTKSSMKMGEYTQTQYR